MLPVTLEALRQAPGPFRFHPFYGHRARRDGAPGDGGFSQWWPCRFQVRGVEYRSAEQFMMAGKARLFGDDATLARILAEPDPAKVKRLGRAVRGFEEERWRAHRFELVSYGSVEKFRQDEVLRATLEATAEAILVEASPSDRIWGVGLSRQSPAVADPAKWRGLNLLGFALTRARGVLRGERPAVEPGPWLG